MVATDRLKYKMNKLKVKPELERKPKFPFIIFSSVYEWSQMIEIVYAVLYMEQETGQDIIKAKLYCNSILARYCSFISYILTLRTCEDAILLQKPARESWLEFIVKGYVLQVRRLKINGYI